MALEIDYNEVLDFGEEAVKSVDEKMNILKFDYNWAEVVEEAEHLKQETKIEGKKHRDPQKILRRIHEQRMREIEDKNKHRLVLSQVHKELLNIFGAMQRKQTKRDPQKILKLHHEIRMKKIATKIETNILIMTAYKRLLERFEAKQRHTELLKTVHNELLSVVKKEENTDTCTTGERKTLLSRLKVLADKAKELVEWMCFQWF
ncbi:uncharacterized protein LOC134248238 [Saccostrea cucullata]|uniref:uncharacterized protein LOC134248238 n=1 Tax=Saccostrea cuccullata TaxID=36930 RepID=UPI002ED20DCF